MSFTRREDGSNVYVYLSDDGYWCDGCSLDKKGNSLLLETADEMIIHLREHQKRGELVPDYAFEQLEKEKLETPV